MAIKEMPNIQRIVLGPTQVVTHAPSKPAKAWLSTVATKIPATIGQVWRYLAARTKANNWVLSPISASATTKVDIKNESNIGK